LFVTVKRIDQNFPTSTHDCHTYRTALWTTMEQRESTVDSAVITKRKPQITATQYHDSMTSRGKYHIAVADPGG